MAVTKKKMCLLRENLERALNSMNSEEYYRSTSEAHHSETTCAQYTTICSKCGVDLDQDQCPLSLAFCIKPYLFPIKSPQTVQLHIKS